MKKTKFWGIAAFFAVMLGTLLVGCQNTPEIAVTGITLDRRGMSLILDIGESVQLKAIVEPKDATNKMVKWSSNDENIATVDEYGNVTAIGVGRTYISVSTVENHFYTDRSVWVPDPSEKWVNLNKRFLTLKINQMEQLIATVYPEYEYEKNKEVSWSSSDESVAIVDNYGNVTAKGKGNATITVKTVNGEDSESCDVTVSELFQGQESYTVKYFYENIDNDEYTENIDERKTKTGTIGETTTEIADTVQGFEQAEITQATIVENEENIVLVNYARKTITFTFDLDGGNWDGNTMNKTISGKYGANVEKPNEPTKSGYIFAGWNEEIPSTFTENTTYKALWTENSLITITTVTLPTQAEIPQLEYSINDNIVTLTAEAGHNTYAWFIEMEKQGESTNTLKINAADLSSGFYSVMVVIDGKFSSTATVTIDN